MMRSYTGVPPAAMAAAAWSWVEKMLQEVQVSSAPRALRVSMRTAVWMAIEHLELGPQDVNAGLFIILMCKQPAMRAPFKGCSSAYFSLVAMRPGILAVVRDVSLSRYYHIR